jgi:hypothetical protein
MLGLHDWYYGYFNAKEKRYERHCIHCDKKQYVKGDEQKSKWTTFK